uniref:Epidermal patterning factor-like protein n=1 Tax=Chenopodium quinoa TaxID=63459 RepID=A0A803LN16_CHEQI
MWRFTYDEKEMNLSSKELLSKKPVLGSRPPSCVNKCLNCNPCVATLVVPPRHQMTDLISFTSYDDHYGDNNHDSYYLLAWKCKCGDKLFQP